MNGQGNAATFGDTSGSDESGPVNSVTQAGVHDFRAEAGRPSKSMDCVFVTDTRARIAPVAVCGDRFSRPPAFASNDGHLDAVNSRQ